MTLDATGDPRAIHTRADLGSALTALRESAGLTVRDLARRVDAPTATVGDYFSGRHLPSPAQLPLYRASLQACGVPPGPATDEWVQALTRARSRQTVRPRQAVSPYPGLGSFGQADAARFFGRDDEVDRVLALLAAGSGPIAVLGPSGSGKSSLLRAGVAAAVAAGRLGADWSCGVVTPGSDPHHAVEAALAGLPTPHRVLVVDQFEEVFTAVADPGVRAAFLTELTSLGPDVRVVIGLRADFYAVAAREPLLLPVLQDAQVLVGPMTTEQLREVIVRPARDAGVAVHEDLVDRLLADLTPRDALGQAHDAGALPLLSHALLATWTGSTGDRLTVGDYRLAGGIDGAVQRSADERFDDLTDAEQQLARRIFVRLVHVDDVAVTRRRAGRDELSRLGSSRADPGTVIETFVEARLLTANERTVEVSHEALLGAWPRLRDWIDSDRSGLRLQRQITDAANSWEQSAHDPGLLLRGGRLEAALDRLTDGGHLDDLAPVERDFLDASVGQRDAERRTARRRTQRLRALLAGVAVLAVVAGVLAAYAFHARGVADRNSAAARLARDNALTAQVMSEARELTSNSPALAEQLALVGLDRGTKDISALIDLSSRPIVTRVLGVQGPTALAVASTGGLVAVSHSDDGSVHLYRRGTSATPTSLAVLPGDSARHQLFALAFLPGADLLATAGAGPDVRLWDVSSASRPRLVASVATGFDGATQSLAASPDGRTLVAAGDGRRPVAEWDVSSTGRVRRLPEPTGVPAGTAAQSVAISPDGTVLIAGGSSTAEVWRGVRPTRAASVYTATNTVSAVAVSPDGKRVFVGQRTGAIDVLDARTLKPLTDALRGDTTGSVNQLAVSPDGSQLIAGFAGNSVRQWSLADYSLLNVTGNPGPVTGVAYSPDSRTVLSTAADGTLRLFPSVNGYPTAGTTFNMGYSADSTRFVTFSQTPTAGLAQVWNTSDIAHPTAVGGTIQYPGSAATGAIAPDGRELAMGGYSGQIRLYTLDAAGHASPAGAPVRVLDGKQTESLAFSPDGRWLAVGGDDNTARVLDVRDPARPRVVSTLRTGGFVFNVAFSADSTLVAAASADDYAHVWDVSTPSRPRQVAKLGGFSSYVYGTAFSPTGARLLVGSADHTSRIWDLSDPTHPRVLGARLVGPTDYVFAVAFSADGRTVATAAGDAAIRLYDVGRGGASTGEPSTTLTTSGATPFVVAFRPDGAAVDAGTRQPVVSQWSLRASTYDKQLCPAIGDPITRAEWKQYVPGAPYDPPCR